ncbi:LolA-like protein [Pontibacter cellulosilyticus]|uniref:Outer membrane lipoprotein-sorting protein n=1 Tax=Pontibacter cellulosilyticus TaxID=1720253 RepID=A0A923SHV0_9BACT|nr:outer membrane lipoprotein-sorting protein [Pontibacter cellulosilyticus]MBC5992078.1 outer membrane lipoprotein-sorting protein [Pontibacter cellulosilyticus]
MKNTLLNWAGILCLCFASLSLWAFTPANKSKSIMNGTELVQAMHSRWHKKWYPNFAFDQRAIYYEGDKITKEEVWQEVYSQPGYLGIRFNGFESGNGVIFREDSLYTFKNNQLQGKSFQIHPLLLLCFDVYFLQPEITKQKLEKTGFDLSKMTEAKWQGRDAYVVGTTDASDNTTPQFWVDKERLYIVRVLTNPKGTPRDVEVNNYQKIEGKWVATEIIFKTDGKTTMREEYFNMRFPKAMNKAWYDPAQFASTKW